VHRVDVVPHELQPFARVVEEARDHHVGPREQAVEERAAVQPREVDADAPLVAAEVLDEEVPSRRAGHEAGRDEAAHRIARARVLDLDDVGAPVAEDRRGGRNEAPVRHLDDPHAREHVPHGRTVGEGSGSSQARGRVRPAAGKRPRGARPARTSS
jgi:hypothetical protein